MNVNFDTYAVLFTSCVNENVQMCPLLYRKKLVKFQNVIVRGLKAIKK